MPKKTFADQIRRLIDRSEKTRYRIALEAGIDHATMSRFMTGKAGLSMEALNALADLLGWEIVVKETKSKRRTK